jgi:sugar (pentulose or hexulose) kinase
MKGCQAVDLVVGLDVGTTRVKALAVTLQGAVIAEQALETPWVHRGAEAEVDPMLLARIAAEVLAALADGFPDDARVLGIGVTGIAEAGALIDAAGQPLAPALAWHDPRGDVAAIDAAIGRKAFHETVGMRLNSKPSLAKILWLRQNIDEARRAVNFLCVAEWIVFSLGGERVSELSLASRTGLLDVLAAKPWQAATDLVGASLLSDRIVIAGEACGSTHGVLPTAFDGAVLTVCGMDHQSAAFSSGAAVSGALFDSMGTAEALLRFEPASSMTPTKLGELTEEDLAVLWGVIPDHVCVLGATLTGLSLERVRRMLGAQTLDQRRALAEAAVHVDRAGAVRIVESSNTGITVGGIDDDVTPPMMWRAAVEDLCALSTAQLAFMESVVGRRSATVIGGGWIHDAMVAEVKREHLGEYRVSEAVEPGAMGAALFAGIAAGVLDRPDVTSQPRWRA